MTKRCVALSVLVLDLMLIPVVATQDAKSPAAPAQVPAASADKSAQLYSGMYSFLKDGEFLQVTVEDGGSVTGYVSRYGDGESDQGAFLDQFFKNGKLEGNKLSFNTEVVHGVSFEFRGAFERGEGKNPGDEAYYVLKGKLTENVSDANKKVTSHSREVAFKLFPQESAPPAAARK
ncbi:MAG TPA: hypothetical protein VGS27_12030 [Candidatus Sulfotelmatobacter sp.]|nr:hypothetical protein [Candidatus Sulfotelmatobacter sp.]